MTSTLSQREPHKKSTPEISRNPHYTTFTLPLTPPSTPPSHKTTHSRTISASGIDNTFLHAFPVPPEHLPLTPATPIAAPYMSPRSSQANIYDLTEEDQFGSPQSINNWKFPLSPVVGGVGLGIDIDFDKTTFNSNFGHGNIKRKGTLEAKQKAERDAAAKLNFSTWWAKHIPSVKINKRSRPLLLLLGLVAAIVYLMLSNPHVAASHVQSTIVSTSSNPVSYGRSLRRARQAKLQHQRLAAKIQATRLPRSSQPQKPQPFKWSSNHEELSALMSFILEEANLLPENHLLPRSQSVDPEFILDFDHSSPALKGHLKEIEQTVWRDNMVLVLGYSRNPDTRKIVSAFDGLWVKNGPRVVLLNERADAEHIEPLLERLLGTSEIPLLLVDGKIIGGVDEVSEIAEKKELLPLLISSGVSFNPPKEKETKKARVKNGIKKSKIRRVDKDGNELDPATGKPYPLDDDEEDAEQK